MLTSDLPVVKPRKKYPEVPIHRPERDKPCGPQKIKKTYSANFSAAKHRHKHVSADNVSIPRVSEVIIEIPEKDSSGGKVCRKSLMREIERLTKTNEDINSKFNELEELSVKKIIKLKEKIASLHNANDEFVKENEAIRCHFSELQKNYEEIYAQLELCKVCKKCEQLRDQIGQLTQNNDSLRKKNQEVLEDLEMLKTVVFRLNAQLERYQEKLRSHNITIEKYSYLQSQSKTSKSQLRDDEIINILSSEHESHRHTPVSWGNVNSHTLGPLLDAYEDALNEKDEIIQTYELEFAKLSGKTKEILEENESLYKKLTEDENCSAKLGLQLENLKTELKTVKEHNDALIKKCAIKQDKIEEILKVYEHKVDQMKRDYQVVHDEYISLRTENVSLKEKIKSLVDSQDDFKNERQNYIPISVHTASVNECKKWYEELKQQYENEKVKMRQTIDQLTKEIAELNTTIGNLKKSREHLEEKVQKAEKEVKKAESKYLDLEHSLNEVQLSRSACRKQLHKAMCFAKDMVAEQETLLRALNQRQLENRAVKKIGSEMAVKMDSLRNQLKDVQKSAWQEFSTVEQRIQEQADEIEMLKDQHNKELEKLNAIITAQEEKLLKVTKDEKHVTVSQYQLFKDKYK
ncbi:protein Cep89 homolog [Anthonomus grandis grandis]|uniref:protein Cep89 homolog n=1 Tax=Anthonomus grandis grandis TaxID=2921223 RepID=UPI002164F841|nr:protein Cep89 homolog [Anthonomus grandis grandis]